MKRTSEETKLEMSEEMKKNCKEAIAKCGFTGKGYEIFLNSVCAMKGSAVLKFPNEQIDQYRERFVKSRENSLTDVLVFDKLSKIKSTNENGYAYDTGFFCPRSFWDAVSRMP